MIDLVKLKSQNKLTTNGNMIYVLPNNRIDFTTYPLGDLVGCIAVTQEEYLGLRVGYYRFNASLCGLEYNDGTIDQDGNAIEE